MVNRNNYQHTLTHHLGGCSSYDSHNGNNMAYLRGAVCQRHANKISVKVNSNKKEIIKMANLEMKKVNELKVMAGALGIKGYSKMRKAELITAIQSLEVKAEDVFTDEDSLNELVPPEAGEPEASQQPQHNNQPDDEWFVDSDTVTYTKIVEFVKADNIAVYYKVQGELVIVGWSRKDYKMHIYSETKGSRLTSYATMVRKFSKLKNGVHGDIAKVVKALKRISKKPSAILLVEQKSKRPNVGEGENVSRPITKENRQQTNRKGVIDPTWLKSYLQQHPGVAGLEIKHAWDEYIEASL